MSGKKPIGEMTREEILRECGENTAIQFGLKPNTPEYQQTVEKTMKDLGSLPPSNARRQLESQRKQGVQTIEGGFRIESHIKKKE